MRLKKDNIDYSHIKLGRNANKNKTFPEKQKPLAEILTENSLFSTTQLKKRLLQNKILENKCSKCGIGSQWCGENLVLQLDHISGDSTDNRIENLRILCPNCHSQTPTYGARNSRKEKIKNTCPCGQIISKKAALCGSCASVSKKHCTKIIWPEYHELLKMVKESNFTRVGKQLGVSDNAVRKRLNLTKKLSF